MGLLAKKELDLDGWHVPLSLRLGFEVFFQKKYDLYSPLHRFIRP